MANESQARVNAARLIEEIIDSENPDGIHLTAQEVGWFREWYYRHYLWFVQEYRKARDELDKRQVVVNIDKLTANVSPEALKSLIEDFPDNIR